MYPRDYLEACVGKDIIVSLKTGTVVSGTLEKIDNYMNLSMVITACEELNSDRKDYQRTLVRGNNVAFILLPRDVSDVVKKTRDDAKRGNQYQNRGNYRGQRDGRGDGGNRYQDYRGGNGGRGGRGGRGGYQNRGGRGGRN